MADLLLVDDDLDVAESLAEVLTAAGHEVRVAYNGGEGLRRLEERLPALVLLDVEMPILDGPGMAHGMIIHNAGLELVPVVILSGRPDLRQIARSVGTPYFLSKPFRYEHLIAVIERALRERSALSPSR